VHIDTPRSQAIVGFLSSQAHILTDVRLMSANRFGAVWVTAMAGRAPISSAARILVTAVGPARSPGMEYEQTPKTSRLGPMWRLKSPGDGAALLEPVAGDLRIRTSQASQLKAWTLDVTGKRRNSVPLTVEAGTVVLKMQPEYQTVYYELSAK
jgi:hypothetical protein